MNFCIIGLLVCLPPHTPSPAWVYASYWAIPAISQQRLSIPVYANPVPLAVPSVDKPGEHYQPAVVRSYSKE